MFLRRAESGHEETFSIDEYRRSECPVRASLLTFTRHPDNISKQVPRLKPKPFPVSERPSRKLVVILHADVVGSTALVQRDESVAHERIQDAFRRFAATIESYSGIAHEIRGDALVAEFARASDAVCAALAFQSANERHNADLADDIRPEIRVGISLGEVVIADGTITGAGVVLAQRLEQLAEAHGVVVPGTVSETVPTRLPFTYESLGEQMLKGFDQAVRAFVVRLKRGEQLPAPEFVATAAEDRPVPTDKPPSSDKSAAHQDIRFCTAADGVRIAYSVVGKGPPLVKAANWLNHLEYDWESPIWRHLLLEFSKNHELVRYDARGNGLSDWDVEDISFEGFVADLEAVVDATGVERFPLFGVSQGCAIAIAYSVRHPARVTGLILYGGFARGRRKRGSSEAEQVDALLTLIRRSWGQDNPAFRQLFTSLFIPNGTREQMDWFNNLQRVTTSGENAARIRAAVDDIDITDLLTQVTVPTLVLHCRDDAVQPFQEGRRMASMIPTARFVTLEGQNHLLLENEPAWDRFKEEVRSFLANDLIN